MPRKWGWLNNLGTEYQFALATEILAMGCWLVSGFPRCQALHESIGVVVGALSSIALGALAHGGYVRGKNPNSDKDLIGDTPQ